MPRSWRKAASCVVTQVGLLPLRGRIDPRKVVCHSVYFFRRKPAHRLGVLGDHVRAAKVARQADLSNQVRVMLATEARRHAFSAALANGAVAPGAVVKIGSGSRTQGFPITDIPICLARQPAHVTSNICKIGQVNEMALVQHLLHALVPTLIFAEIDQLLEDHRVVLSGDGRNRPIGSAGTVRAMTARAGRVQLAAASRVGYALQRRLKFLLRCGRCTCRLRVAAQEQER